jgi:hypothetical protein
MNKTEEKKTIRGLARPSSTFLSKKLKCLAVNFAQALAAIIISHRFPEDEACQSLSSKAVSQFHECVYSYYVRKGENLPNPAFFLIYVIYVLTALSFLL